MLWIALTTQVTATAPVEFTPYNLRALFTPDDYPSFAQHKGEEGAVLVQVLIAPDGRVDSCKNLVSSHHNELDSAPCRIIRARAHFAPPTDPSGRPTYGVLRQVINWNLGGPVAKQDPQLELSVNRSPAALKLPVM